MSARSGTSQAQRGAQLLLAVDARVSRLDDGDAVLVLALVATDPARRLGIGVGQRVGDGLDTGLVVARPRLLAGELCDLVDDRRAILALALVGADLSQLALREALQPAREISSALCLS